MTLNSKIPITIITGFLGSGKTTLLQKILQSEQYGDTAILVNEFGEIGIDQYLVDDISSDVILLATGCLCCQIHGELKDAILSLYSRREKGEIPYFKRIIVETTGLAEPGPIASTIFSDPVLSNQFRLCNIVTVVDAQLGANIIDMREEWVKQVAAADLIFLSKTDLVEDLGKEISAYVAKINPTAKFITMNMVQELGTYFFADHNHYAQKKLIDKPNTYHHAKHQHLSEGNGLTSFILNFDADMDWVRFGIWFSAMLQAHGLKILRVKGILNVGEDKIISFNAVQHIVYPPSLLNDKPSGWKASQLVFIVNDLSAQKVIESFWNFVMNK